MKKAFLFLFTALLLPLSLFGCNLVGGGTPLSFDVNVYSSSSIHGTASGTGTFNNNSTVTLTAAAKSSSQFLGWIFQDSTLLENANGYTIKNTLSQDESKITNSTLTFKSTEKTQGKYVAVFKEDKILYTTFDSFRYSDTITPALDSATRPPEEVTELFGFTNISQGRTQTSITQVFDDTTLNEDDDKIANSYYYSYPTISDNQTNVLLLSPTTSSHVIANANLSLGTEDPQVMTLTFRAELLYQTSSDWQTANNYSYMVDYADGVYEIIFEFAISADENLYLTVVYSALS